MSARNEFWRGAAQVSPTLLGVAPFGLIAGALIAKLGLSTGAGVFWTAVLSVGVFAGTAHITTVELLAVGAPMAVIVFTGLVINLRMLMYSAALAPYFSDVSLPRRAGVSYLLTDQAFAFSVVRFARPPGEELPVAHRLAYYLGVSVPVWLVWQVTTVCGALVGGGIPVWLPLDFAIPLTFLALLVPSLVDRPTILAGVVSAAVATAGAGLPSSLGIPTGAVAGVLAGVVASRRPGRGARRSGDAGGHATTGRARP